MRFFNEELYNDYNQKLLIESRTDVFLVNMLIVLTEFGEEHNSLLSAL